MLGAGLRRVYARHRPLMLDLTQRLALILRLADRLGVVGSNVMRLSALKDAYAGRRCFVIGNGPSLRVSDLDLLKDDVTIASNKIFLAFGQTDWRPTYYTVTDHLVMENTASTIRSLPLRKIFPAGTEELLGRDERTMFCPLAVDWVAQGDFRPGFSTDIRTAIYGGESVTYFNLQIASYLGCREIYLIGVDFSFKVPQQRTPDAANESVLEGEGEQNHFIKDYRPVGERWTMPHMHEQEMALRYAREFLDARGVRVYNASRQSALTVFDRADFDSLFDSGRSGARPTR